MICLFVFYVPSTARSYRDGTPIYCPLRPTWSSVNTPVMEPRAVVWQSIMRPLHHTSSALINDISGLVFVGQDDSSGDRQSSQLVIVSDSNTHDEEEWFWA